MPGGRKETTGWVGPTGRARSQRACNARAHAGVERLRQGGAVWAGRPAQEERRERRPGGEREEEGAGPRGRRGGPREGGRGGEGEKEREEERTLAAGREREREDLAQREEGD
uniref:Uncharacterized protein n=1 Tax=Oryza sativa subsp. japonica TaxID=39947 RepID=Q5Z7W3_ORYSJ|nr:hypothetical protein [Oryza sativa Japonica Group]